MGEPIRVEKNDKPYIGKVTAQEIAQVKRDFILSNLCLSAEEVGAIFGKGAAWAIEKLHEGRLVAVDDKTSVKDDERGNKQVRFSRGARITAESVQRFRSEYLVTDL